MEESELEAMKLQFNSMRVRMTELELKVEENTTVTKQIKEDTAAIVGFFKDAAGGGRMLLRLGKVARWLAPFITITAGIAAWLHVFTTGPKP